MSTLQQNWNSNEDPLYSWCLNSINIQNSLSRWSKIKYGNIDRRIEELQKKIASRFRSSTHNSLSLDHIILEDLAKQEMLWKQKAHDNQINFGDCNNRYFLRKVENKWRNSIHSLNIHDNTIEDDKALANAYIQSWGGITTTSGVYSYLKAKIFSFLLFLIGSPYLLLFHPLKKSQMLSCN